MPLTNTELHEKAQLCLDLLTEELNMDRVEIPESAEGYLYIPPNKSIQYKGYGIYFHGFAESSWANRYVIAERFGLRVAEVYILGDPLFAAETTALILRNLTERN